MANKNLSEKMKTPQERGILADCLFGDAYVKKGRLYIKREVAPQNVMLDIMGELGPADSNDIELILQKEAELAGLKPLKTREVCLDLFEALKNAELGKGLTYKIIPEELIKKDVKVMRKIGTISAINIGYGKLTSAIYLSDSQELFFIGFPEKWASEELMVSTKIKELQGVSTKDILTAYRTNLSALSKTSTDYLEDYRRNAKSQFQKQLAKFKHR